MSNIDDNDCEDDINDGISPPTPGPWKVVTSWCDHMVEGPNGEAIIWQDGPYDTPTIKLANARLIAAAPEMFELIQTVARTWEEDCQFIPCDTEAASALSGRLARLAGQATQLLAKIEGGEA